MKFVVIGGTGLIGSKVVDKLKKKGHEVIVAVPATGVNTLTGEGLDKAMTGADTVIDVSNSPSFEEVAVMNFFEKGTTNIMNAEKKAGVKHHLALSVVGTERLQGSGYFRAKMKQEQLIKTSNVPYTILHATQFFEFMGSIVQSGTSGNVVLLPDADFQPISSEDVSETLVNLAVGSPKNSTVEVAGPEKAKMAVFVDFFLKSVKDSKDIVSNIHAKYFGTEIDDRSLVPGPNALICATKYRDWLSNNPPPKSRK